MLVLARCIDESIEITGTDGARVVVTVVEIRGQKVRLGISAPIEVEVNRSEIQKLIDERRRKAANDSTGRDAGGGGGRGRER